MKTNDEGARKARANRLHEQIDELVEETKTTDEAPSTANVESSPAAAPRKPESPREFVHRRMRELGSEEPGS
jgi:hypothetical protein